jgi:hypothetical protein
MTQRDRKVETMVAAWPGWSSGRRVDERGSSRDGAAFLSDATAPIRRRQKSHRPENGAFSAFLAPPISFRSRVW